MFTCAAGIPPSHNTADCNLQADYISKPDPLLFSQTIRAEQRAVWGFEEFTEAVWEFLQERKRLELDEEDEASTCRICVWKDCWTSNQTPWCTESGPSPETEEDSGSATTQNSKIHLILISCSQPWRRRFTRLNN